MSIDQQKIQENIEKLKGKKIYLDNVENIKNVLGGDDNFLLNDVEKYDSESATTISLLNIYILNIIYYIQKYIYIYIEYFIYHIDNFYKKDFSYYHFFLSIIFILIIFIIIFIFYWDYIYRDSNKNSRCKITKKLIYENDSMEDPFIYNIVIIHKDDYSKSLDDFVLKIQYNFLKNITTITYGNKQHMENRGIYIEKTKNPFNYFDLNNMCYNELKNIDKKVITNKNYKYIVTSYNGSIINTEYTLKLAQFIRNYGYNRFTQLYPIYDILNAVMEYDIGEI